MTAFSLMASHLWMKVWFCADILQMLKFVSGELANLYLVKFRLSFYILLLNIIEA